MPDTAKTRPEDEELKRRVIEQLDTLDIEGKRKVLDFSRELATRQVPVEARTPRQVSKYGGALLAFAGTIPKDDLREIQRAVEEDCETVDEEGW